MRMYDVRTGKQVLTGLWAPGEFAAGGRFAGTSVHRVSFCRLAVPAALQHFGGHNGNVQRLAWWRDGRYLASLDTRFELRVWDVGRGALVRSFRVPEGNLYANNAAVALSAHGGQVAYASGGEKGARAGIFDVKTGRGLGDWALPGGFERMACVGRRTFLLVREEFESGRQTVRTVVRELTAGNLPRSRVLRRAGPGGRI
jgi:hypothetical protein